MKENKSIQNQFGLYLIAAAVGYVFDFSALYILHQFLGINYLLAAATGFVLGLVVVYILSSLFVFSDSKIENKSMEIGLFSLIGLIGLGILSLLMWIFVGLLGLNYLFAKILATVVVYIWNFLARRAMYNN